MGSGVAARLVELGFRFSGLILAKSATIKPPAKASSLPKGWPM
jgi:hypothetical protein